MRLLGVAAVCTLLVSVGCSKEKAAHQAPATVANPVKEADLTTVTLTDEAVKRLGIEAVAVELSEAAPTRTVGGEVVVPPGQSLIVSAPVAGTVLAPQAGPIPSGGSTVRARQTLMRLVALPADRDLLRTEQDLAAVAARLRQTEAEAKRVSQLYSARLVSAQENERVTADLESLRAQYQAAVAQQGLIQKGAPRDAAGLTPLAITAPESGIVRTLSVAPGQAVAAGAPLAEIVRLDRLWIRVPIYAGTASDVDRRAEASVHGLSGDGGASLRANPVAAPPSADALASAVHLFYELRGAGGRLRPGERVGVTLPLIGSQQRMLSVPVSSIVRDMSGGAWVYEKTAPTVFRRRRVEVIAVAGQRALLSNGPEPGVMVVTAGAAELFGTEFGAGK